MICVFEILYCIEMKKFTLEQKSAKNIDYIEKYFKQKSHRIKFSTKSSVERIFLSTPRVELEGSRDFLSFQCIIFQNSNSWGP